MADVIDRAQAQADFHLQREIDRTASDPSAESEPFCVECGDTIPEARREAVPGCRFCVTCQMELESRQ